jgi:hypothetical protein
MNMMSNSPAPERIEQAVVFLASNLSREEYLKDDLRASAYQEGMGIVGSVDGIRVMSEQKNIGSACVHGPSSAISTLHERLKESGRVLTIDNPEEPMLRSAW